MPQYAGVWAKAQGVKVMNSCIFCEIASHSKPATLIFEDDLVVAFRDIRPVAPVHVLICPKKHIPTLNDVTPDDHQLLSRIFEVARDVARQCGVDQRGYRTIFNCNAGAGQTVFHLHLHLLGGRPLGWPEG